MITQLNPVILGLFVYSCTNILFRVKEREIARDDIVEACFCGLIISNCLMM